VFNCTQTHACAAYTPILSHIIKTKRIILFFLYSYSYMCASRGLSLVGPERTKEGGDGGFCWYHWLGICCFSTALRTTGIHLPRVEANWSGSPDARVVVVHTLVHFNNGGAEMCGIVVLGIRSLAGPIECPSTATITWITGGNSHGEQGMTCKCL
jgi:hypothetical protein